ncbi:MAG: hypothetical protein NUW37_05805 [Planctomycetes bacterium]|nr:hypothetical protein [Planctomycetota bacterium]
MLHRKQGNAVLVILLVLGLVWGALATVFAVQKNNDLVEFKTEHRANQDLLAKQKQQVESMNNKLKEISGVLGYSILDNNTVSDTELALYEIRNRQTQKYWFANLETKQEDIDQLIRDANDATDDNGTPIFIGDQPLQRIQKTNITRGETLAPDGEPGKGINFYLVLLHQDRLIEKLVNANHILYEQLEIVLRLYKEKQAAFKTSETQLNNRITQQTRDLQSQTQSLNQRATSLQDQLGQMEPMIISEIRRVHSTDAQTLRNQLDAAQETSVRLEREIQQLKEQQQYLTQRGQRRQERRNDPDGVVTYVDRENDYIYINLGNQDGIQPNMRFTVFTPERGGGRTTKGTIEVRLMLGNHFSQCALIEEDQNTPIYPGDLIFSPLFDQGEFRTFAFAGTFGGRATRFSKEHARQLLIEAGANVVEKIDPSVDVLIIGQEYELDENYERALELKVELMTERELHAYLGYQ